MTVADRRECTAVAVERPPAVPPGWGDYAELVFASIGITPESYCTAKAMFGLPPTCNCADRKEWLNRVSDWWRGQPTPPAL